MNSRQRIKEEFTYYLSNLVKSSRAIDGEYKLNKTSVNSYLSFLEVNKLFDYDENKSKVIKAKYNITSMYDITSEEEICDIAEELLKDKDFIERDKKNKVKIFDKNRIHSVLAKYDDLRHLITKEVLTYLSRVNIFNDIVSDIYDIIKPRIKYNPKDKYNMIDRIYIDTYHKKP